MQVDLTAIVENMIDSNLSTYSPMLAEDSPTNSNTQAFTREPHACNSHTPRDISTAKALRHNPGKATRTYELRPMSPPTLPPLPLPAGPPLSPLPPPRPPPTLPPRPFIPPFLPLPPPLKLPPPPKLPPTPPPPQPRPPRGAPPPPNRPTFRSPNLPSLLSEKLRGGGRLGVGGGIGEVGAPKLPIRPSLVRFFCRAAVSRGWE